MTNTIETPPLEPWHTLTRREQDVALQLAQGLTCTEIAKALGISVKTADTHRAHVLTKMGCKNAVLLARTLIREGRVTP